MCVPFAGPRPPCSSHARSVDCGARGLCPLHGLSRDGSPSPGGLCTSVCLFNSQRSVTSTTILRSPGLTLCYRCRSDGTDPVSRVSRAPETLGLGSPGHRRPWVSGLHGTGDPGSRVSACAHRDLRRGQKLLSPASASRAVRRLSNCTQ